MVSSALFARYYPDGWLDGTQRFYGMVRRAVSPDSVVLNLGAGPATHDRRRCLRGEVARVVGADIDPIVLTNDELDEALTIDASGRLPFDDSSFDVVLSDYVLEHIEQPRPFLREVHRVLKPGGTFFFRTPNVWHYTVLLSQLTPHWFHGLVANRARGLSAQAHAPWPTFYRMNRRGRIERLAREAGFAGIELRMVEAEPVYLSFHPAAFILGVGYERAVNSTDHFAAVRANIFGRLQKSSGGRG